MHTVNLKKINSEEYNGFISADTIAENSLSFNIDLPKGAAVDHIRIIGEFKTETFDKQKDVMLEDILHPVQVTYHREAAFEALNPNRMQRVAGTLYNAPADLYKKVQGGAIDSFDVYYHFEAVTEA